MHDVRAALRALARKPGFAAIAIVTLALGIGGNSAIFSIIDAVLLRPLPYPRADRLVMPWEYSPEVHQRVGYDRLPSSPGDVTDFRARNRTFAGLASFRADRVNVSGTADPERIAIVRVSHDFFDVLGVQPMIGRRFNQEDEDGTRVVLLGYGLWERRYARDPSIVGTTISLDGQPTAVLGVLPRWFRFPAAGELPRVFGFASAPDAWVLDVLTPGQRRSRAGKSFALIGRLKDGVSPRAAEEDLAAIAADIARESPASNAGWTVRVVGLRDQIVGGVRSPLLVLLTAVGFVLLIACVNVANLLLVRATARQREMSVRHALGAERRRLVRQLLIESVLMALLGGVAALFVAWATLRAFSAISPVSLSALSAASLDLRVVAFTMGISVLVGLAFGLVPAIQSTRFDVSEGLREGTRGTVGSRRALRTRNVLVTVEVALAAVLLVGALLLIRTFVRLVQIDPGFRTDGVLTMEIVLPAAIYSEQGAADFFERLVGRLAQVPGIQGVAVTSGLPLAASEHLRQVTVEGQPRPRPGQEIIADYRVVTPDYFPIMGIPHIMGEPMRSQDESQLLISATMAASCWPGQNPLGRRLKLTSYEEDAPWFVVSGVVGDTRQTALESSLRPQVYVHQRVDPDQEMVVVMRTVGDPLGFAAVARAAVHELDPNQPVGQLRTMDTVLDASVSGRRFTMLLVGAFAALALALSLVGLYAVVSHSVAERTQEMGVRLALGATPTNLLRLVMTEAMTLVAAGVATGLIVAAVMTRFIQTLLFGVTAHDAMTFVVVPLLLFAAAALGCVVPARRAMRVNPMVALKTE